MRPVCLFDAWQFPTLAWGDPTLPSALRRFTSEFGMGSGGTTALQPPGKSCCTERIFCTAAALAALAKSVTYHSMLLPLLHSPHCFSTTSFVPANFFIRFRLKIVCFVSLYSPERFWRCKVKPPGSLVPVSSTHRCAYTPGLSTSSSSTSLRGSQGPREDSSRGKFRA